MSVVLSVLFCIAPARQQQQGGNQLRNYFLENNYRKSNPEFTAKPDDFYRI